MKNEDKIFETVPQAGFDLRDRFAAWSAPPDTVANALDPVQFIAIGKFDESGELKPLNNPMHLDIQQGQSGIRRWMGELSLTPNGPQYRQSNDARYLEKLAEAKLAEESATAAEVQAKKKVTYRIRVTSEIYSTVYFDSPLEGINPLIARINLDPGLNYPFPNREPARNENASEGRGPTLISGVVDEKANALVVLVKETSSESDGNEAPNENRQLTPLTPEEATRCLTDSSGRFLIAIHPDTPVDKLMIATVENVDRSNSWSGGEFQVTEFKKQESDLRIIRGRQTSFPIPTKTDSKLQDKSLSQT